MIKAPSKLEFESGEIQMAPVESAMAVLVPVLRQDVM